ncbi:MAG: T9SS type A sorting domain-containing protein [bacterium]
MKKIFIISSIILFIYFNSISGWNRYYGGSSWDEAYSVKQTSEGGFIIVGYTYSAGIAGDVYLIKTNEYGDTNWTSLIGGEFFDVGQSVQQTADGGFIIGAVYDGLVSSDFWLIKTDSLGDTVWTKKFGDQYCQWCFSVEQTADHGYIAVGYSKFISPGSIDIWLVRVDSLGDSVWIKDYGSPQYNDVGYSVKQTLDSGFIVAGSKWSEISNSNDFYLIKTDTQGNSVWEKSFGGNDHDDAYSVQLTSDNGYIVTGYSKSFGAGSADIWLVKTDNLGDTVWTKCLGGNAWDEAREVQQTTDGGYILIGSTQSFGSGNFDFWLVKTDSWGDTLWTRTFGGSDDDWGYSVQPTVDGGYILTGITESFGSGFSDIWLIKTNAQGLMVEQTIIENPTTSQFNLRQISEKTVSFSFILTKSSFVELEIYDVSGRFTSIPISGFLNSGYHAINFKVENSGIYFLKLNIDQQIETVKFTVF